MAQGAMQACSRVAQPLPPGGWVGWAALGTADRSTKGTLDAAVRLCYGHATISRHVGRVEVDGLGLVWYAGSSHKWVWGYGRPPRWCPEYGVWGYGFPGGAW
jgi:hypothetical protein